MPGMPHRSSFASTQGTIPEPARETQRQGLSRSWARTTPSG
eukprot:CAMPEP_0114161482 /NCGR_PEP_ID=MMETSP0043_2-20121206/28957_1 /TAXON_ID=464988 /ORGANISM="Hemiselmis andersenii, Strain CCMP644" /LENGTH=40 /DNA_ID= /DNA_START= /DNA_END= /DNA_ORIENTATION=